MFLIKYEGFRAREVFKRLRRSGTLHSDQVWARGEPWGTKSDKFSLILGPLFSTLVPFSGLNIN